MLDFVQIVTEHVARYAGLDEESRHWLTVAIRESVINAIKHGNRNDESKLVFVDFDTTDARDGAALEIRVRDQGEGFDPTTLPDPLAPENLLKTSGRGIFLMRAFMDEVRFRGLEPGTEVTMLKRRSNAAGGKEEKP
jgi:serine/threonine-protein kinase RsbW